MRLGSSSSAKTAYQLGFLNWMLYAAMPSSGLGKFDLLESYLVAGAKNPSQCLFDQVQVSHFGRSGRIECGVL